MLKRRVLSSLAGAAIALGLLTQTAAAADTAPAPGTMIVADRAGHYVADGDRVLYTLDQGAEESAYDELHLYDLRTQSDRVLDHDVEAAENSFALTGPFAVFIESTGPSEMTLFAQNLDSGRRQVVAKAPRFAQVHAQNQQIVWIQPVDQNPQPDSPVYHYDLNTGAREVAGRVPDQTWWWRSLLFDGRNLVWTTDKETVALDVQSHKDYHLAEPYGAAAVRDGRVLIRAATAPCGPTAVNLILWEPATGAKRTLATGGCDIGPAQINSAVATWSGDSNKTLYGVNLATGAVTTLVPDATKTVLKSLSTYALTEHYVVGEVGRGLGAVSLAGANPPAAAEPTQPKFYTVKSGDLLWKVAQSNQVSLADLMRVNNLLMKDWLFPGQQLFLPYPVSPRQEQYTVRAGDTAWKIAMSFRTTLTNLRALNPAVTSWNELRIGQVLTVSRGAEPFVSGGRSYQTYAVMPGDTLWKIADRAYTSVSVLMNKNNLTNSNLVPGQMLLVGGWS